MKADRLIRPGRRKQRASARPSRSQAAFPLSDYIISPRDSLGGTAKLSFSVAPAMKRLLSIIHQQDTLPFETEADVARWCLHQGIQIVAKIADNEEITSSFSALRSWLQTTAKSRENRTYQEHLNKISAEIDALDSEGHEQKALELADRVWRQTDRLEDPYWREFYRKRAKGALDELKTKVARRKREMERRAARNGDDR